MEVHCDPGFCSGGVHVLLNLILVGIKKHSRKTEAITAGIELMKHGSKSCFNKIPVAIKKNRKVEWTTILGFRGATTKSSLVGAVASFLTMAVILTVIAECCMLII
jgi:hypothetical protein